MDETNNNSENLIYEGINAPKVDNIPAPQNAARSTAATNENSVKTNANAAFAAAFENPKPEALQNVNPVPPVFQAQPAPASVNQQHPAPEQSYSKPADSQGAESPLKPITAGHYHPVTFIPVPQQTPAKRQGAIFLDSSAQVTPVNVSSPAVGAIHVPETSAHTTDTQSTSKTPAEDKKPSGKKEFNVWRLIAIIAASLLAVVIIVFVIFLGKNRISSVSGGSPAETSSNGGSTITEPYSSPEFNKVEPVTPSGDSSSPAGTIYRKVLPSSVGILVYSDDELLGEGSGVILTESSDGKLTYIITCAHVICDSGIDILVRVNNSDGSITEYTAARIGYDNRTDIGVLSIEASGLTKIDVADSDYIRVGDTVYAIGNPGGTEFENSFTNGMISALDRPVSSSTTGYTMQTIQHTAPINPGNSGGALVNEEGQLIGINSMKIVDDSYEGMGFSIPSNVFIPIFDNIIENGYVAGRPKLGITYVAASEYKNYEVIVSLKDLPLGSIVIYSIADDSPLASSDAQVGDMITSVNGIALEDKNYLAEYVEKSNIGDELTLHIVRVGKNYSLSEFDVKVALIEDRGDTVISEESEADDYDDYGGYDYGDYYYDPYDFFKYYFGDEYGNFNW